jgi:hypothetical protein
VVGREIEESQVRKGEVIGGDDSLDTIDGSMKSDTGVRNLLGAVRGCSDGMFLVIYTSGNL